jgi:hypothetical protein
MTEQNKHNEIYNDISRIPERMLDLVASKRKGRNPQVEISSDTSYGSNSIETGDNPPIAYSRSMVRTPDGKIQPRAVPPKNNPEPLTNPSE